MLRLRLLFFLILITPCVGFAVEIFGMVGSDYASDPLAPWPAGWKGYLAGGLTFPINSRLDAEAFISKRADFDDIDRAHLGTNTGLISLFGELAINVVTKDKIKVYGFGGAGLLHYEETGVIFNGPLPDDDLSSDQTFNHFGLTTGIGTKIYFNQHLALRPELRFTFDTVDDFNSEGINNVAAIGKRFITIAVGIAFSP